MSRRTYEAMLGYGIDSRKANELVQHGYTVAQLKKSSRKFLGMLALTEPEIEALKSVSRKGVPLSTLHRVLYDAGYACCLCRSGNVPLVVHHIEPYSETQDNSEENLVVLCLNHHAEAHAKREISQTLTPDLIKRAKREWNETVARGTARQIIDAAKGDFFGFSVWSYFNHSKIGIISIIRGKVPERHSKSRICQWERRRVELRRYVGKH